MMTTTTTMKMSPGERSVADAMWKGFRCRCPNCGEGRLFRSFLKPVESCERMLVFCAASS